MAKKEHKGGGGGATGDKLLMRALGPAADELGQELAPLGREVGEVGVRAARALLRPLSGLVWGYEQIEGWVAESLGPKIDRIPPEHRVEPKLIVAGPILDGMRYAGSEPHLRDMFANLLATSMDGRVAAQAHPAFVEMVKQLSPDEARLLSHMARGYGLRNGAVITIYRAWESTGDRTKPETRMIEAFGPYTRAAVYSGCQNLRQVPTYVSNLCRLEIFRLNFPSAVDADIKRDLLDDDLIKDVRRGIDEGAGDSHSRFHTGWIHSTPLGEQFLDACVRRKQV